MQHVIILHHHEIVLKGDNRQYFESQLLKNIRTALSGLPSRISVSAGYGRSVLRLEPDSPTESILERLEWVFGLANICPGIEVKQDLESVSEAARSLLTGLEFKTIRVHATRADKNFPFGSMEINRKIGEDLCTHFQVRADLSKPDETIFIEVAEGSAFVYRTKKGGAGGLPSGTGGKTVSLISAGFDSPVASWKIMKRGASVIFVHFHSLPYTSQRSVDQVRELVKILTRYQYSSKLYLIPFSDIQEKIVLHAPAKLRVILYRRMMLRIAESIARKEQAEALVTGEALGQVASQTLRNIRNIDAAATFPVLRPLSGSDKEETMLTARKIGTYDISKEPYDDCCSFLAPRRPETWSKISEVEEAESKLDVESIVDYCIEKKVLEHFVFPEPAVSMPVSDNESG
jgi:tRNA uracil 4-sulfurtransferase